MNDDVSVYVFKHFILNIKIQLFRNEPPANNGIQWHNQEIFLERGGYDL